MEKPNNPSGLDNELGINVPNPKAKTKKGLIITLLILLVLALGGIFGTWYYMNQQLTNQKNQNKAAIDDLNKKLAQVEAQANAKKDESATKNFKTKYELLNFNYPANYSITDKTRFVKETNSGIDDINLKSSNGFDINMMTGVTGVGGACNECTILLSEPVTIAGNSYYLNYVQDTNYGNGVSRIVVAKSKDDFIGGINAKNALVDGTDGKIGLILISAGYKNGDNYVVKSLSQIKSDPNVQAFKNFLQSLSY